MHLCYVDESGTPEIPGTTSHFILAGVSIPIWHWRNADREITRIKQRYELNGAEIHTAWMLRKYIEQSRIKNFERLPSGSRRSRVEGQRASELHKLQKSSPKRYRQARKNYSHTEAYIHLTWDQRREFLREIADCVANWGFSRLFAECIDKAHFTAEDKDVSVSEQAFEQIISRFERYLQATDTSQEQRNFGLIVHDNNQTVETKHTRLMRDFHKRGTPWISIERIIETPLFVDSQLTSMVQIADLCAYALRRFLENEETDLFNRIFARADRVRSRAVGVRHYTTFACKCEICEEHRQFQ